MNGSLGWRQILLVLGAFGFVLLVLSMTGVAPPDAFRELVSGSLGSKGAWRNTLRETTPLLVCGIAVLVALKAGLFNIGADGQLLVGAMVATGTALTVAGPWGVALAALSGALAGALWALPAGWIRAYRGGHEVITTIMLNNVAAFLCRAMVNGPMKAPGQQSPTTDVLPAASRMPWLVQSPPFRANLALLVGVALVPLVWLWLRETVSGYELAATGSNATAAKVAGVDVPRVAVRAMALSGALAGLAGAMQVLAYEHRFYDGFSPGYGFDALGVALLSGGSAWGLLPSALLFGVLSQGATAVQLLGVPKGIGGVMLGLLIVVFAAFRYRRRTAVD